MADEESGNEVESQLAKELEQPDTIEKEIEQPDTIENEIKHPDIIEKDIHSSSSSSSSDSEIDNYILHSANKIRLFGRKKPLHMVLGGGKSADIVLWRNKQASACVFAAATVIWLLFEYVGYHLLTFLCHALILALATLFLWSNLASFINVSPPEFPKITLQEDVLVGVLLWLRAEINRAFITLRDIASGKNLRQFLAVISVLWVISVVGNWFSFLTLFYLVFAMLLTVPMTYERHEDQVDTYTEKAWVEVKRQYAALDEKFIQKLPLPILSKKDHKQQ